MDILQLDSNMTYHSPVLSFRVQQILPENCLKIKQWQQ